MNFPDIIHEIKSHWPPRVEDREACAARTACFLERVRSIVGKTSTMNWYCGDGAAVTPIAPANVSHVLEQHRRDDNGQPMPKHGWNSSMTLAPRYLDPDVAAHTRVRCGAWVLGNSVDVLLPDATRENPEVNRAVAIAIVACFEPQFIQVFSRAGGRRRADNQLPFPIVDWIVYHADCVIPPEVLPMVHSVEHVGTGTLVIMKKERLHLDRPEDLALVETVEPILRRYFAPPPKPTVPEHRKVQ